MRFKGKNVLITGAKQGIGRAIAIRFAQEGAQIIIEDLIESVAASETAINTLAEVRLAGSEGFILSGDISNHNDVENLLANAARQCGHIDILINNAAIETNRSFLKVTEDEFDRVMDVNLKGAFFMSQAFARLLIAQNRTGHIINISSVHEELPFPGFASYCASKGGDENVDEKSGRRISTLWNHRQQRGSGSN